MPQVDFYTKEFEAVKAEVAEMEQRLEALDDFEQSHQVAAGQDFWPDILTGTRTRQ